MNTYRVEEVCPFSKAKEQWGMFGNMTGGYPIRVNGILVPSTEHLYQMMRYTEHPEIQQEILQQGSGMGAKMISKKYRKTHTRSDFEEAKIDIMMWCLQLKASCHKSYRDALALTRTRDIVEKSHKDTFWGAKLNAEGTLLIGENVLGQLHMIIRDEYIPSDKFKTVFPPSILDFNLLGNPVPTIIFGKIIHPADDL